MQQQFILLFVTLVLVVSFSFADLDDDWNAHKKTFGKSFSGTLEEAKRKAIFTSNSKSIDDHNKLFAKGLVSFMRGKNQFTDMTFAEVEAKFMGARLSDSSSLPPNAIIATGRQSPPSSRDWRLTAGRVRPVKNQGSCGSCWAFSTISAVESAFHAKTGRAVVLSEQNLVDCTFKISPYNNFGCGGGDPYQAYNYIFRNNGVDLNSCYPYQGATLGCRYKTSCRGASISGVSYDPSSYGKKAGNETWLLNVVGSVGPVSVAIFASQSFMNYKTGVFNDASCSTAKTVNHAVVVVGYGTQSGQNYWLVRNSWGTGWGESGYIKMRRGASNQCFISSYSMIPIIK